jgi:hypothetical protein
VEGLSELFSELYNLNKTGSRSLFLATAYTNGHYFFFLFWWYWSLNGLALARQVLYLLSHTQLFALVIFQIFTFMPRSAWLIILLFYAFLVAGKCPDFIH